MTERDHLVTVQKDGDTMVQWIVEAIVGTLTWVSTTCPVLTSIDKIIEFHVISSDPKTTVTFEPQMIQISGKTVGFTIGCSDAAGSSLAINIAAVGF